MKPNLDRYCYDLPTHPVVENKILITGATGFIGGELIPELVARGYSVRALVRTHLPEFKERWPSVEIVVGDVLNYSLLEKAFKGIHVAYYLVHSLHMNEQFIEIDSLGAENFRRAAEHNKLKRIIYLGSLGDPWVTLSDHLKSRLQVAADLKKGKTPVTFLRAAVIIGSGSASYKMINHLVRNCPLFLLPKWAASMCQPIAIRDVVKYLVGSLEQEGTTGNTYDIGGPDILSYLMMLKIQAEVLKKRRLFIKTGFSNMNLYAGITAALTPIRLELVRVLMESCINNVTCHHGNIKLLIPFQTISYKEALERASTRDSQEMIFKARQALKIQQKGKENLSLILSPPKRSTGIISDIRYFLLHKPEVPTLIKFNSIPERENYTYRILQRLSVEVSSFKILNVHKIGVNAPAKYIFEELLKWNGDSTCWPNYIAKVVSKNNKLENLFIYLFGWTKFPNWIKNSVIGRSFIPLFMLNSISFKKIPDPSDPDNARYLLFSSSGGYPIGIFSMYVRSSIPRENEEELSQMFLIVGFNFYGKKNWPRLNFINRIWESIHDRVTSNVLDRFKQLCEWRFEKLKSG